jgi:cytochrome c-type biogenesis protein CcmH
MSDAGREGRAAVTVRTEPALERASTGRRASAAAFVLSIALLAAGASLAFVAVRGPEPPRSLPDRVHAVAATLRCPVCQNLSVADSPSGIAQQMRDTIRSDLQAGKTPDQIRAHFVASYGDWILLSPPRHGVDLAVWIVPILLLGGGLVAGGSAVRRWTAGARAGAVTGGGSGQEQLSSGDRRLLEAALSDLPEEEPT